MNSTILGLRKNRDLFQQELDWSNLNKHPDAPLAVVIETPTDQDGCTGSFKSRTLTRPMRQWAILQIGRSHRVLIQETDDAHRIPKILKGAVEKTGRKINTLVLSGAGDTGSIDFGKSSLTVADAKHKVYKDTLAKGSTILLWGSRNGNELDYAFSTALPQVRIVAAKRFLDSFDTFIHPYFCSQHRAIECSMSGEKPFARVLENGIIQQPCQNERPSNSQLKSFKSFLEKFANSDDFGDPVAQVYLGNNYKSEDLGFPHDAFTSLEWMNQAAQQGFGPGYYYLGKAYELGECSFMKSDKETLSCYLEGAELNDPFSLARLGIAYERGDFNLEPSPIKAAEYYKRAFELGIETAGYLLFSLYLNFPELSPKADKIGQEWLRLAVEKSCMFSRNILAVSQEIQIAEFSEKNFLDWIDALNQTKGPEAPIVLIIQSANDSKNAFAPMYTIPYISPLSITHKIVFQRLSDAQELHTVLRTVVAEYPSKKINGLIFDAHGGKESMQFGNSQYLSSDIDPAVYDDVLDDRPWVILNSCSTGLGFNQAFSAAIPRAAIFASKEELSNWSSQLYYCDQHKRVELSSQVNGKEFAIVCENGKESSPCIAPGGSNWLAILNQMRKHAKDGNPQAQFQLALYYSNQPDGAEKYRDLALKWARKSVEQGFTPAYSLIGKLFEKGTETVPKSDVEAIKWYLLGMSKGDQACYEAVGRFYAEGRGRLPKAELIAENSFKLGMSRNDKHAGVSFAEQILRNKMLNYSGNEEPLDLINHSFSLDSLDRAFYLKEELHFEPNKPQILSQFLSELEASNQKKKADSAITLVVQIPDPIRGINMSLNNRSAMLELAKKSRVEFCICEKKEDLPKELKKAVKKAGRKIDTFILDGRLEYPNPDLWKEFYEARDVHRNIYKENFSPTVKVFLLGSYHQDDVQGAIKRVLPGSCVMAATTLSRDTPLLFSYLAKEKRFDLMNFKSESEIQQPAMNLKRFLEKQAANNNAAAALELGKRYKIGDGSAFAQNEDLAIEWFRIAAEQGSGEACAELGSGHYLQRSSLLKSEEEAFRWFERGAELKNPQSLYSMGYFLLKGLAGKEASAAAAESYFKQAAEMGHQEAMFVLSILYDPAGSYNEEGIERLESKAYYWCERAAIRGHQAAIERLALLKGR